MSTDFDISIKIPIINAELDKYNSGYVDKYEIVNFLNKEGEVICHKNFLNAKRDNKAPLFYLQNQNTIGYSFINDSPQHMYLPLIQVTHPNDINENCYVVLYHIDQNELEFTYYDSENPKFNKDLIIGKMIDGDASIAIKHFDIDLFKELNDEVDNGKLSIEARNLIMHLKGYK